MGKRRREQTTRHVSTGDDALAIRQVNKRHAAVAATIATNRLANDMLRPDAALVVAKVTGSLLVDTMWGVDEALLQENKVRNLNVGLGVGPAGRRIAILEHSRVKQTMQRLVLLTVGLDDSVGTTGAQDGSRFALWEPQDSGDRVRPTTTTGSLGSHKKFSVWR